MKPHSHEEHIQHSFDAFCKKVLRNEARDYQDALARKRNREVYFSELPIEVLEQFAVRDTYFTDGSSMKKPQPSYRRYSPCARLARDPRRLLNGSNSSKS